MASISTQVEKTLVTLRGNTEIANRGLLLAGCIAKITSIDNATSTECTHPTCIGNNIELRISYRVSPRVFTTELFMGPSSEFIHVVCAKAINYVLLWAKPMCFGYHKTRSARV